MKSYLADTIVSSFLYGDRLVLAFYLEFVAKQPPIISFQTFAEMRYGAKKNRWGEQRRLTLANFLEELIVIGYSSELADCWVCLMYQAERIGRRLEPDDAWIAATALLLNVPLLTHDKDFLELTGTGLEVFCRA